MVTLRRTCRDPFRLISVGGCSLRRAWAKVASRAYYAIYLVARDQLFGSDGVELKRIRKQLQKNFRRRNRNRNAGRHEEILFAVSYKALTLHQQMNQLQEARINADYFFSQTRLASLPHA